MQTFETRHLSTHIDRPVQDVYDYASDPAHLPEWAPGLGESIEAVDDGTWIVESAAGRVVLAFTPPNEYGVLDHRVTTESGETLYNPMRVTEDGAGSEVVFSLRRRAGTGDDDFARDAEAVLSDLVRLKQLMERR